MVKFSDGSTHGNHIECPACGYIDNDSWEFLDGDEGSGEYECGSCEAKLTVSRNVTVSYSAVERKPDTEPTP